MEQLHTSFNAPPRRRQKKSNSPPFKMKIELKIKKYSWQNLK